MLQANGKVLLSKEMICVGTDIILGKSILFVSMQWDYCDPSRGLSADISWFFDNLKRLSRNVDAFWFDSYMEDNDLLQELLIKKSKEMDPDLIFFIPYTNQFKLETLDYLRDNYKTFCWFGDDPWRFNSYTKKYALHFTHVATTDLWSVEKYREMGITPILTQWASQPYSNNIGPLASGETYEYDVSFVGGIEEYREWFIKVLKKRGVSIECFGYGWPNGKVNQTDLEQIFRKSKINLNISNSISRDIRFVLGGIKNLRRYLKSAKIGEQIKARNFEIPLAGGFQLTNYVLGLEKYFLIGEEIAVYNSPEECILQIKYALQNDEYRERIIQLSHQRAKKEHTYYHRLKNILGFIFRDDEVSHISA